jgi:hypothetical protein
MEISAAERGMNIWPAGGLGIWLPHTGIMLDTFETMTLARCRPAQARPAAAVPRTHAFAMASVVTAVP